MSETTKRAIPTDLGTRWAERVDATHLIAKPVPYHAARANLRTAEGGAERDTTNFTNGNWRGLCGAGIGSNDIGTSRHYDGVSSRNRLMAVAELIGT